MCSARFVAAHVKYCQAQEGLMRAERLDAPDQKAPVATRAQSVGCDLPATQRLAASALVLLLAACSSHRAAPPAAQPVVAMTLRSQPVAITADYIAQTEASNTVEIRPRVGGVLESQSAREGERVQAGQVLFQIDRELYAVALEQAKATLAQAHSALAQSERDLARVRPLSKIDAVSQKELDAAVALNDSAQAQVQAGKAAVDAARLNLGYATVRAPIDGIVGRAQLRVGGLVTAYTTLLTMLYQTDPMYVNFSISERRLLELQRRLGRPPDQNNPTRRPFRLVLADGSDYPLPAQLNFVDAAVDQRTDTLALRLTVPNPKQLLRAGQYARVIVATEDRPNAILIPQRAVQTLQDKNFVWLVDAQVRAQPRDVTLGQRVGNDFVIEKGLAAGDQLIIEGVQRLKAGSPVRPQPAEPATREARRQT
jgi:membrane fusion protein, multidrug efflux system